MKPDNPYQEDFFAIKAFEKLPENRIKVSTKLENPYPIVADTLKVLAHKEVLDGMCVTPTVSTWGLMIPTALMSISTTSIFQRTCCAPVFLNTSAKKFFARVPAYS